MNENYESTKAHYLEASMQMLDHFNDNVIEVHHIGSTSIRELNSFNDIDVLVILKTITEVSDLADVLIAEGYEVVPNFNGFFKDETVVRGQFNDYDVNFIFMSFDKNKKSQVLVCKELLLENEDHLKYFQNLKQQHNDSKINKNQYQHKKMRFFSSLLETAGNLKIV